MTTRVHESAVIQKPLEDVWATVRTLDFGFWSAVESVKSNGAEGQVGAVFTVKFRDGTVQQWKLLEFSDLEHFLTYDLIESEPSAPVLSAIHTVRLRRVTSDNTTFIEWTTHFSSDAKQDVVQDSKYKKHEAFADLSKHLQ